MKAIIENGKTYKVTGERGDFFIAEINGKVKMFAKQNVEVVEIESMPAAKSFKSSKSKSNSGINMNNSLILGELNNSCNARRIRAAIEAKGVEVPEIVTSILNQADYKSGQISEKQVYVLAKFATDNDINLNF